jgi:tetratricopeptide (TPR) repeat protein
MPTRTVRIEPYALTDPSDERVFTSVVEYAGMLKPNFVLDATNVTELDDKDPDPHVRVYNARYGADSGVQAKVREQHDPDTNGITQRSLEVSTFGLPDGHSALIRYETKWDKGNRSYIELQVDAPTIAADRIASHFRKAFPTPGDDELEKTKQEMQAALQAQRWGTAEENALELLAWRPDDPEILLTLGTAVLMGRDIDRAERIMNRLLEVKPDSYEAHLNLGSVWMDRKDYDKAIEQYQAMVDLQPGKEFAPFILATAYEARGDSEKAIELYKQVLRLEKSPGPTDFHDLARKAIGKLIRAQNRASSSTAE